MINKIVIILVGKLYILLREIISSYIKEIFINEFVSLFEMNISVYILSKNKININDKIR